MEVFTQGQSAKPGRESPARCVALIWVHGKATKSVKRWGLTLSYNETQKLRARRSSRLVRRLSGGPTQTIPDRGETKPYSEAAKRIHNCS